MAIEHGIWKIAEHPVELKTIKIQSEDLLEEQIFRDLSILNSGWMLIGRQVRTDFDKRIDLLAVDASGSIVIIELKKHKTPRDVVAQTIDYAAWVEQLESNEIAQIYEDFYKNYRIAEPNFDKAFETKFGIKPNEEDLNSSHQMVIVAAELDASTERIINYLNDKASIAVNAVFFKVFEDNSNQYLSRAWMIDPGETQQKAISKSAKEPWNGEFYTSFGHSERRHWDDAKKYGFISAGGGLWYSKTLNILSPGDRIWTNVPGTGYVGVGEVVGDVVKAVDFIPAGEHRNLLKLDTALDYGYITEESEDSAEYIVPVKWVHTLDLKNAFIETGLFGRPCK